jgi:arylformamidase
MWADAFTFPGDRPVTVRGPLNFLGGDNPEYVYELDLASQAGTHVQGPHYFLEAGARVNDLPLERFEGPAHVVDIAKRGEDTTAADLREALDGVDARGGAVLLRSGHMDEVIASGRLEAGERPGLSMDAAVYLVEEQAIGMVAIDSVGVESRASENYEVNVYLCSRGVVILEGLVNLRAIRSRQVWLEAFPLKIRGVEGTPCRAIVRDPDPLSP